MSRWLLLLVCGVAFAQQQPVNIGTAPNNGTGDPLRTAFTKINANTSQLYAEFGVTGLLRGNGAVPSPLTLASAGDVTSVFGAGCNGTTFLRGDGICSVPSSSSAGSISTAALAWATPSSLNATNTWINEQGALSGPINTDLIDIGRVGPNFLVYNDTAQATCSICNNSATVSSIWVHPKLNAGYDGFRFGVGVYMDQNSAPVGLTENIVAGSFLTSLHQFNSVPNSILGSDGSGWGINPNAFITAAANANNVTFLAGAELNVAVASGSVWRKFGLTIPSNGGDSNRGYLDDHAIQITVKDGGTGTKPGWRVGLSFGSVVTGLGGFGTDSSLIASPRRELASTVHQTTALYGVDWRQLNLTAGGCFYAATNYCIDNSGNVNAGLVNVSTGVVSQSTGVASITINSPPVAYGPWQGGGYNLGGSNGTNSFPPIAIDPSPAGVNAVAAVSSMALQAVALPGPTGVPASGCSNNEVITVALGGTSGNTNGTITVTVSGGNITAASITTAGSYVSTVGNTGQSLTGSTTCNAGTVTTNLSPYIVFGITGTTVSNHGTGYNCNGPPSVYVSGSGYINATNTPASMVAVMQSCALQAVNFNPSTVAAPISMASPGTAGFWFGAGVAAGVNDSTSTGIVANETFAAIPANTITATSATTYTNYSTLFVGAPTCGTNTTCTNGPYTIQANGATLTNGQVKGTAGAAFTGGTFNASGGNITLNNNSGANTTGIGTGTTSGAVTLGGGSNNIKIASELQSAGTTFTVASGTGACATTSTLVGGVQAGSFLCTGTAGASTVTITLPTAPNGWSCWGSDVTSGVGFAQSATTTTSGKLSGTIGTTSDKVVFGCLAF